jgi:hypothetical protein
MSFLETDVLTAISWFFLGVFSFKILTKVLNYGHMVNIYKEMLLCILTNLRAADENFQRGNDYMVKQAIDAGEYESEKFKLLVETNEKVLATWKNLAITSLVRSTPLHFKGVLKFNNWDSAMRYLKKGEKGAWE